MTGTSDDRSAVARVAGVVGSAPHFLATGARRLWHAIGGLAEMLSDAGHGPRRWRENADIPNPYAGSGPVDINDDTRPQE